MTAGTHGARGPIRLALLGCGRISRLAHLPNILADSRIELVGIAEADDERRRSLVREAPGVEVSADVAGLLRSVEPQAVVIALPTLAHREAALAAFGVGAHVFLEKPIAAKREDACAIVRAWRESGRIGMIGFNCRRNHLYLQLRRAIARGDIGKPVAARTAYTAKWPADTTWRLAAETGGGAFLELASHHVDLLRFIFDAEVRTVIATSWSNRGDDVAGMLQMELSSGVVAHTMVSYGTVEEDRFEVYGSNGKLTVDRYDSLVVNGRGTDAVGGMTSARRHLTGELRGFRYGIRKRRAPGEEPSYGETISAFTEAVLEPKAVAPDIDDGLRALEVIDAARRSASEHRMIVVRE